MSVPEAQDHAEDVYKRQVLCSLLLIGIGVVLKQNLKTFIPGAIVSSVIVYVVFQQLLNVMLS